VIPRVFWKCLFSTSKRPYAKPQRKKREVTRMKAQTEKVSVDQKVVCGRRLTVLSPDDTSLQDGSSTSRVGS
jgi:hypothetical protein